MPDHVAEDGHLLHLSELNPDVLYQVGMHLHKIKVRVRLRLDVMVMI